MSKAIDLGQSYGEMLNAYPSEAKDKVHYPDFHIPETDDERLWELPDKGEATIKFKVVSRRYNEDNHGDDKKKKRTCSYTIEVQSIEFEPEPKKKNGGYGDDVRKSFSTYFKGK